MASGVRSISSLKEYGLARWTIFQGRSYTQKYTDITNWTQWVISKKEKRKQSWKGAGMDLGGVREEIRREYDKKNFIYI